MVRLNRTYYSLLKKKNYKQNFQNCLPQSNSSGSCKFRTVRPHSSRTTQNSHILLTYSTFQTPASTENAQEFQRITQIPRSSPTQSANYAKFAPFANITTYVSDAWPVAENSLKFQRIKQDSTLFAHLSCELREFCAFHSKLIHIQLTFRSLTINREPRKIGANQPDFAQFAHNSHESREIC